MKPAELYNEFVPSRELLVINDEANSGGNTVVKYTSSANAFPELNQNKALHTAQYYLNGYTGTITVQGTMDPISGSLDNWVDIKTDTYSAITGNEYTTFNGVYTAIRFKQSKTAGTLTKVLYRP